MQTQTQQLIEQVRQKLGGATDYKIAQVLDLHTEYVSGYVHGERNADSYACAKIAEVLGSDPMQIIARVEAESARSEKKRDYWRTFFSSMKRRAHGVVWLATFLSLSAGLPGGSDSENAGSHNGGLRQRNGRDRRATRRGNERRYLRLSGVN